MEKKEMAQTVRKGGLDVKPQYKGGSKNGRPVQRKAT